MSNPPGSDGEPQPTADSAGAETEHIATAEAATVGDETPEATPERRFTAPSGFDAGKTQIINTVPEPETEVFAPLDGSPSTAPATEPFAASNPVAPQLIPGRADAPKPPTRRRSWGWVIAVVLVILAIVAVAIFGTVLLTRNEAPTASREDEVRTTIQNFDTAIQKGDLATLRSITCGSMRDDYVNYDQREWSDTYRRIAAAKQYPVVANIDQVVVNGNHAEANVTAFMAYAPQTRSTRSFDLQYRDDQWKICESNSG